LIAAGIGALALVRGTGIGRFSMFGQIDQRRLDVYQTAIKMVQGHELLG
jgi:hypothetical protein